MDKNAVKNDRIQLVLLKEIEDFIIPLSKEEFFQLEKNIVAEGCRDPLIVWQKKNQLVLIDGHNRYKICKKNGIPFKVKKVLFKGIEQVKSWMVDNQIGRRNLTPDQMSYYRGLKYLAAVKKKGGYENVSLKGNGGKSTSDRLADEFNVSESTVKRNAKFAEGLKIIEQSNPTLKVKILRGDVRVKKADIQVLASAKNPSKITIKNEADLYNKAKVIREEILKEVESGINKLKNEKVKKAQESLKESEPVFLERGDRLRKIKGMIVSLINRAITKRDSSAIQELKKLVDRLDEELFE